MQVFRLCKSRWADSAFSGEGAVRFSGRWHFAGTAIVYTAASRSLAALEMLVHMEVRHAPPNLVLIPAEVPEEAVTVLDELPPGWDSLPPTQVAQRIGSQWIRSGSSLALRVPSVVVRGEHNVLLNPAHPHFARIEIHPPEPFAFDPRLLGAQ